jgi:hypothetical protein
LKIIKADDMDETYVTIHTDDTETKLIIGDFLSAFVDGYLFQPSYRAGVWDGKKKYYILHEGNIVIYKGLVGNLRKKLREHQIDLQYTNSTVINKITREQLQAHIDTLGLPFAPYDYQFDTCLDFINRARLTAQLATGAGKSLIAYIISTWFRNLDMTVLVLVPNVSLTNQLHSDFVNDYKIDRPEDIHLISAGKEKTLENPITISTWQSSIRMTDLLEQVDVLIIDECLEENTLITLEDGSKKKIKDIEKNDIVKTLNEITNEVEMKPVVKIHKNIPSEKMFKIVTESGTLKITGNHKVKTLRGWVRADALTIEDEIISI